MSNNGNYTVVIVGSGKTMLSASMTALANVGTVGHVDHSTVMIEKPQRTMTLEIADDIVIRAFPEPMIDPEPDPSQNYLKLDKRRHRRGGSKKWGKR